MTDSPTTAFTMDDFAVAPRGSAPAYPEGLKRIVRALYNLLARHGDGCTLRAQRQGNAIVVTMEDLSPTLPTRLSMSGDPPAGGVQLALPERAVVSLAGFTGPVKITIEPAEGLSAIISHVPCVVTAGAAPTLHPITTAGDGSRLTGDAMVEYP